MNLCQSSYNCHHPAVVKIQLKNYWIQIVSIKENLTTLHPKDFIRFRQQLISYQQNSNIAPPTMVKLLFKNS